MQKLTDAHLEEIVRETGKISKDSARDLALDDLLTLSIKLQAFQIRLMTELIRDGRANPYDRLVESVAIWNKEDPELETENDEEDGEEVDEADDSNPDEEDE